MISDVPARCYLCSNPPIAVASFGPAIALAYCAEHKEQVVQIITSSIGKMLFGHDGSIGGTSAGGDEEEP